MKSLLLKTFVAACAVNTIVAIFDGRLARFMFAIALCLALCSCAGTTGTKVYHNGQKILETSADADEMTVTPNGTFSAKKLNHSRPIMARSKGIERILKSGGAAVGQGGRAFLGP